MSHSIGLKLPKAVDVQSSDVVVVVRKDGERLGTLTISRGTIDWRPRNAKSGKKGETQLTWSRFAQIMESENSR